MILNKSFNLKHFYLKNFCKVTVFDSIFKGLSQPVLGAFSIDLSVFIKLTKKKLKKKFDKVKKFVESNFSKLN